MISISMSEFSSPREIVVSKEVIEALADNGCCQEHDAMVRWKTLSEFRARINEYLIYSEWHGLVVTDDAINCVIDQMNENRLNCAENSDCDECEYFGRPSDAPETVKKDCMWEMVREEKEPVEPPCMRREDKPKEELK